jgi:predicted nucleic acid-binding protein
MEVILIDTSVWVNVFKGLETKASIFLRDNSNIAAATCPTIVQEVLQGIVADKDHSNISIYFNNLVKLPPNGYNYAREAADLYRSLRKKGIAIRKPNDCLIAIYALKNNIPLLHDDKDFTNIAAFSNLKTVNL